MQRRTLITRAAASAWALGLTCPAARAQAAFPQRALRIVVPFGAGGVADLTVRAVGAALADALAQPVIVDNRPGAGGVVAGETVARAEPDGHTLLLISNGTAVSASLFRSLPFNPRTDFAPISLLGTFEIALVVPDASPHRSLQELLAWARAKPQQLNIGTVNVGSTQHLAAALLCQEASLPAQVVPYNGTPALLQALRGGQVDLAVEILAPLKPQLAARTVRLLAVMGESRVAEHPQVPAVRELPGLGKLQVSSWNALAAPARTPAAVIDRLHREVIAVLAQRATVDRLAALGVQARASTPQQLSQWLDAEIRRWSGVIAAAGIARQ
jgi:tripartite-type tricarboxylate transporter receptor subunit TctC